MRQINIVLDLYSAALCLILFCYLYFSGRRKDKMRCYFIMMCLVNFVMSLADITNWTCEGFERAWYPAVLKGGSALYYACTGPMLLGFIGYMTACISHKNRIQKYVWNAEVFLCIVQVMCSFLSLYNGMYFRISTENLYIRGDYFGLSQLIPLLMYLLDIVLLANSRALFRKKDFLFLSGNIVLPLAAEVVQYRYYGIALLNTGITMSILLMFINIQSEREILLQKQEKELAESRIDVMLSQIQPHFLYNMLTTIRRLCDSNPAQAGQAILDFSLFLRANMDSLKSKAPIPFEQELSHARHYLALEQQRFKGRLKVVWDTPVQDFTVPPLSLQPIVENAVRHGILKKETGGTLIIRTKEDRKAWYVIVEDDGVGYSYPADDTQENHIGIENVQTRLEILCGGRLEIHGIPGEGTVAVMEIPKEGKC